MPNTGNLTSLAERLRAKTEQDAQKIEKQARQQFESLSRSFVESSKNALSTTEAAILKGITDMEQNINSRCRSLGEMFSWRYLCAIALSAGILMVTVITCWGLITLYRYQITDLQQEIAKLKVQKEMWERDFPPIQRAFSGLMLHQEGNRNYLILPEGRTARNGGMLENREAWELVRR